MSFLALVAAWIVCIGLFVYAVRGEIDKVSTMFAGTTAPFMLVCLSCWPFISTMHG